jgi:hypothetical protein
LSGLVQPKRLRMTSPKRTAVLAEFCNRAAAVGV